MQNEAEIKVKSLQKAIEVLNCFTKKNKLGVTEISEQLGLNKSNVHSILTTFRALDYLEQDEETGKYSLGLGLYTLNQALGDRFTVKNAAVPFMQELSNITGERVYLAIPHKDEVVYLSSAYPRDAFNMMRMIGGERAKMYCTGIGKAMLAYLPEMEREEYINMELLAFTENTITDANKLREELCLVRKRGYAIDDMEHEFGVKCVAAPIFNKQGKVEAAVSISGPSLRFGQENMDNFINQIKIFSAKIQERL